jgi:serine/threonine-protein kinase RsbW
MPEAPAGSVQPAADSMSYTEPGDLGTIRAFVRANAVALGLPTGRADLLTLAVSELTTNTLQHTNGGGRVRVWAERGQVVCDVVDTGPARSFGRMPEPESIRGRGLAIVAQVADDVSSWTGPEGTVVRIRMNMPL